MESSNLKPYNYLLIDSKNTNKELDIISPLERHKDTQQINARSKSVSEKDAIPEGLDYSKEETTIESTEGVNQFYTEDYVSDSKVIQKQSVPSYDSEQVPSTVYNDISQKLMQKQQNDSSSPKIDNRYGKKLNQCNLKPSVSNVFSSLNEYINAPPGSSDCIHSVLNEQKVYSNLESKTVYHGNETSNFVQSSIKDSDKSIVFNQTADATSVTRESSVSCHQDVSVSLEPPITCESDIKEDPNIHAISFDEIKNEEKLLKEVSLNQIHTELSDKAEAVYKAHSDSIQEDSNIGNQENDSIPESTYNQSHQYESNSTLGLEENEIKLNVGDSDSSDQHGNSLNVANKPIGFSNIENLSEDELTKYLIELEEEEKLNEECKKHENVSVHKSHEIMLENTIHNILPDQMNESKTVEHVSKNLIVESPETTQKEFSHEANISVTDYKKEETLINVVEKQNSQFTDELKDDNISNKEVKSLHTIKDDNMVYENTSITSENECLPNAKNVKVSQEHCMYNLNINQESLSNGKTEMHLKAQKENPPHYSQACELKIQGDDDNVSEEKRVMTPEITMLNDKTRNCDDMMSTSMEASIRPNVSDSSGESEKPVRPQTLDIVLTNNTNEHQIVGSTSDTPSGHVQSNVDGTKEDQGSSPDILDNSIPETNSILGKQPPFWVPDSDAPSCMLCDVKFTVMKRRHHCRACGKVLCSKCCNMKYKLEYQGNINSRVCVSCYQLLTKGN